MADPLWINVAPTGGNPAYTATELRQAMALPATYEGRALGGRAGVRPGGTQLNVTFANPTLSVAPGVAYLDHTGFATTRGGYWVAIPTTENHTAQAADGTNPRKDIIILRVYDHDEDSSGMRLARTEYLVGTPAGSPVEPAVPTGAFRLATFDVPNTGGGGLGSAVVTNNFPFTAAHGGVLPVRNSTEESALTAYEGRVWYRLDDVGGSGLRVHDGSAADYVRGFIICTSSTRPAHREGRVIYETDTDIVQVSDGAAWTPIRNLLALHGSGQYGRKIQTWRVAVNATNGQSHTTTAITYPTAFSATPVFVQALNTVHPANEIWWHLEANPTTTGFTIAIGKVDQTNFGASVTYDFDFLAIGT